MSAFLMQMTKLSYLSLINSLSAHIHTSANLFFIKIYNPFNHSCEIHNYIVVHENHTPVTSSNNCTKYGPISINFGSENCQGVFSLQVGNRRILIKVGTNLHYFHGNHVQQITPIQEMGTGSYYNFKNLYEFKGYGAFRPFIAILDVACHLITFLH